MRIVILGAGYAGVTCAVRLARKARGRADITLVNASHTFVERIRLHEQAAGRTGRARALRRLLPARVRLVLGRVSAIDPGARTVTVDGLPLAWDRLVLAAGSQVATDAVPGIREHAFTLDAPAVARLADLAGQAGLRGGRLLVIGGGLTGVEAAAELAERWPALQVTLLTRAPVGDGWAPAARAHLLRTFARLRVELREGERVVAIEAGRVRTATGTLPFDACIWAGGFVASPLARAAGLAVNDLGQVLVDAGLRSLSHPHVYAAGDSASPVEPVPMGCKVAGPMGAHVADNLAAALAGRPERAFDWALPMFCVSLGRHDGLVQVARRGAPTGRVITGWRAARIKELICRSTVWALHLDRVGIIGTRWMRTGRAPALELPAAVSEPARAPAR